MRIEIVPDQKTIDFQNNLIVDELFIKKRKSINLSFLLIIVLFSLSLLLFSFNFEGIGTLSIIFAIFYLFYVYNKYDSLLIEKSRILACLTDYPKEQFGNGNFIFTEKELRFYNNVICSFTNWNDFEDYKIVKRNILLSISRNDGDIVVISELEVGKENFNKIITFINKIGMSHG